MTLRKNRRPPSYRTGEVSTAPMEDFDPNPLKTLDLTKRRRTNALQIGSTRSHNLSGVRRLDAAVDEAKSVAVPVKPTKQRAFKRGSRRVPRSSGDANVSVGHAIR